MPSCTLASLTCLVKTWRKLLKYLNFNSMTSNVVQLFMLRDWQ